MRFSVGKKVGGAYVGTSVSSNKIGKYVLYFFAWPFILCYFIFIWPFVKLYKHNKQKKNAQYMASEQAVNMGGRIITMSPAEAKASIANYQRIAEESTKILQETKDPEVYFKRYDMAIDNFERLAVAYQVCGVQNNVPQLLQTLRENYNLHTNSFIDRYAKDTRKKIYQLTSERGKANRADAFKNILLEYKDKLTPENLQYIESKYMELKELIPSK